MCHCHWHKISEVPVILSPCRKSNCERHMHSLRQKPLALCPCKNVFRLVKIAYNLLNQIEQNLLNTVRASLSKCFWHRLYAYCHAIFFWKSLSVFPYLSEESCTFVFSPFFLVQSFFSGFDRWEDTYRDKQKIFGHCRFSLHIIKPHFFKNILWSHFLSDFNKSITVKHTMLYSFTGQWPIIAGY